MNLLSDSIKKLSGISNTYNTHFNQSSRVLNIFLNFSLSRLSHVIICNSSFFYRIRIEMVSFPVFNDLNNEIYELNRKIR